MAMSHWFNTQRVGEFLALAASVGQLPRAVAVAASCEPSADEQLRDRNRANRDLYLLRLSAFRAGFCPQPKDSPLKECAAAGVDFRTQEAIVQYEVMQLRAIGPRS